MRKKIKHMKFKTIRSFGREVYSDKLALEDALEEKIKLKNEVGKFK